MTTSTNMNDSREGSWGPCPKGAVQGLVASLRRKRQRREVLKVGTAVCMLAIVCGTAWLAIPRGTYDPEVAGLHCSEVLALADDLIAGKLDDLTRGQIVAHCSECESCHNKIVAMRAARQQSGTPRSESKTDDRTASRGFAADLTWPLALHR